MNFSFEMNVILKRESEFGLTFNIGYDSFVNWISKNCKG